jgi:glycerol-3-phosphate dehydrogenase
MNIIIIGAGVVGSLIARELCRYNVSVTLIEKNIDVGQEVTKANSAIIHAGYDDEPSSVRAKFCVKGNAMYTNLSQELDFEVKRIGSLVAAFNEEEINTITELYNRGINNNVPNLKLISAEQALEIEPNLNPSVKAALYAPTAGITEPWTVAIAAVENAVTNGLNLILEEKVTGIEIQNKKVKKVITDKNSYTADIVINAAGLYADDIAAMACSDYRTLHPRRGEYILLSKVTSSDLVKTIVFPAPGKMGKGVLVLPTVDGGILLGPTSQDLDGEYKEDKSTTQAGIDFIIEKTKQLIPKVDIRNAIKTFAGLRPESPQKDFWIEESQETQGFINASAMRSPGLTAAPAVAMYIAQQISQKYSLKPNLLFNPQRKRIVNYINELGDEEYDTLIKQDPLAGRIICSCNKVSEREIIQAIKRGARSIDGVKFRTRAMFGDCQGSFCTFKIMQILSRELGINYEDIRYNKPDSRPIVGNTRD